MKVITKYQIYDQDGDRVLEPYANFLSAQYMIDNYFPNYFIVEVEIEL